MASDYDKTVIDVIRAALARHPPAKALTMMAGLLVIMAKEQGVPIELLHKLLDERTDEYRGTFHDA